jgi:PAS domain S-box-containing protein
VDEDSLVYGEGFGVGFAQDGDRLPIADSFADEVLRTREPLVVWDVLHDARIRPDSVRASGVRSLVALPLVAESRVLGLLSVHGSTPRVFDSEEVQALSVVAGFIAVAFADAERFEENHYLLAERTAALAAARESEERYRTVTDEAPLRIAVIDAEQRYQFVNQTISVAHRRPASEILGRRLDEIIIPVNYARLKPYVLAALAGREQSFDAAWDIPGESSRILATRYVPRRDESGAVTGFYVISSDETDHRRLQEQVQRTQRMEAVGQLAGGIAHDFNNLLTVIGGFAQVLGADSRLADDQREDVEEIVKATRRAGDLTRRLLAFSRKQTLQPSLVDLNTVIIDNERMLRRLVREDIEYITDLEPGLGQVFADLRQLEHVLVNLIVNARDAMPQEGRITIETRELDVSAGTSGDMPAGQWVRLRVVDTGAGMTPEVLEHVFEPFFTTKPAGEGTGLGLAMVYGIVEQSGGVIRAESTPGTGTVFTILLPRAAPSAPPRHTPATVQAVSATGELILLVEDEEPVRMLAVRLLKRAGYEVVTARNGREAAEIIDREPRNIQLVVSDIVMPEMGGIELGHYVRFRRPATRLLFISGYAAAEIERRGGLPADAGFLQKPFSSNALANAVRDALTVDV